MTGSSRCRASPSAKKRPNARRERRSPRSPDGAPARKQAAPSAIPEKRPPASPPCGLASGKDARPQGIDIAEVEGGRTHVWNSFDYAQAGAGPQARRRSPAKTGFAAADCRPAAFAVENLNRNFILLVWDLYQRSREVRLRGKLLCSSKTCCRKES